MKEQVKIKIANTLKEYYKTEKGLIHRNKLSSAMKIRMKKYNDFLTRENNRDKTNNNYERD